MFIWAEAKPFETEKIFESLSPNICTMYNKLHISHPAVTELASTKIYISPTQSKSPRSSPLHLDFKQCHMQKKSGSTFDNVP